MTSTPESTSPSLVTDDILDPDAAARLCGCEPSSILERLRTGELPGIKFGRSWVLPRDALIKRLNEIALAEAAERRAQAHPEWAVPQPVPTTNQQAQPKRGRGRPRKHYSEGVST